MIENHWAEIEAEYCLAEGGTVIRRGGRLEPHGGGDHGEGGPGRSSGGTRSLQARVLHFMQGNAVLRLSQAVAKVGSWQPPMRLNDTTRVYFEKLATVSSPEDAARYNGLLNPDKTVEIQKYPCRVRTHAQLRTAHFNHWIPWGPGFRAEHHPVRSGGDPGHPRASRREHSCLPVRIDFLQRLS